MGVYTLTLFPSLLSFNWFDILTFHIIGINLWTYVFNVQLCYMQMSSVFITFWHAFIFHFMSIFIFSSPLLIGNFIKDAQWIFRISLAPSILPCTGTIRKELWVEIFSTLTDIKKYERLCKVCLVHCFLQNSEKAKLVYFR